MSKSLTIFVDGACSGNPGEASIGVVVLDGDKVIKELAQEIGQATNNIAEYTALIYGLQEALIQKAEGVKIFTDSQLMAQQVNGHYKISNATLKYLADQVKHLVSGFRSFEIQHIPREENKHADKLATGALKKKQAKVVAPLFSDIGEESPSSKG